MSKEMLLFLAATFAVTWPCFTAVALIARNGPLSGTQAVLASLLLFVGTFAPGIAAVALTARREGAEGVRTLLRRLLLADVPVRWYVFAAGYTAAIKLTTALIHRGATGAWPRFGDDLWLMPVAVAVSTLLGGQAGEELGWRGYALPRLAARHGYARASLILGVIWAAWHFPLFFVIGADTFGQSFARYTLQATALSVAMTWLFVHTRGSLLLAMLMHAAFNNTKDIVPSIGPALSHPFGFNGTLVGSIALALIWVSAFYFLARMPRQSNGEQSRAIESSRRVGR